MSQFDERLQRDLAQIADRASPSSDAWEAIRRHGHGTVCVVFLLLLSFCFPWVVFRCLPLRIE